MLSWLHINQQQEILNLRHNISNRSIVAPNKNSKKKKIFTMIPLHDSS